MILLQNLIALIFLFFVGVTVVGVITYLLLCYKLQKYMVTKERDYWKRIGEPGFSFDNSITRSKAFGQFIRNRGYLEGKEKGHPLKGLTSPLMGDPGIHPCCCRQAFAR
jgi:hypothetical protein